MLSTINVEEFQVGERRETFQQMLDRVINKVVEAATMSDDCCITWSGGLLVWNHTQAGMCIAVESFIERKLNMNDKKWSTCGVMAMKW